ncbi:hypothetical protein D3C87_1817700 [compost metagenome]
MDVAGLAGEGVADVVEVLLDMLAHLARRLQHHALHLLHRVGRRGSLCARNGGGHDLFANVAGGAEGAFDQTARGLIVIVAG